MTLQYRRSPLGQIIMLMPKVYKPSTICWLELSFGFADDDDERYEKYSQPKGDPKVILTRGTF